MRGLDRRGAGWADTNRIVPGGAGDSCVRAFVTLASSQQPTGRSRRRSFWRGLKNPTRWITYGGRLRQPSSQPAHTELRRERNRLVPQCIPDDTLGSSGGAAGFDGRFTSRAALPGWGARRAHRPCISGATARLPSGLIACCGLVNLASASWASPPRQDDARCAPSWRSSARPRDRVGIRDENFRRATAGRPRRSW